MITKEQAEKLNELIENFASARECKYYVEDQGSRRQEEDAKFTLTACETDLDDYIRSITE